jgi:predicted metal-dependent hydrolase
MDKTRRADFVNEHNGGTVENRTGFWQYPFRQMLRAIYNKVVSGLRAGVVEMLVDRDGVTPIEYRKRPNARRYILRVNAAGDGGCVTIPRGGSLAEARTFAKRNANWLEQRLRQRREAVKNAVGSGKILFRGEEIDAHASNSLIPSFVPTGGEGDEARLKRALWQLARKELPGRVAGLAAQHGLTVKRVSVRNQRSRWGSCSARGLVSLNWRLVQTPDFVRDYIIVHELMHLRQMNHSSRYWKLVYEAFPQTDEAEKWLKRHAGLLRERMT